MPWRENKDPYRIWLSEVMLQQTTVAAVIPFYERFLKTFPKIENLAKAPEGEVLQAWAGLGYYSRARNLHKASKILAEKGFPKTAAELLELPGFGPYTSAAVASIAFGDPSGVLDGNVIRVLTRFYGLHVDWWNTVARKDLQARADAFAKAGQPDEINQAMMELGATVCTPSSPACLICPWAKDCVARETNQITNLPRPKPRRASEIWIWSPTVHLRGSKVGLALNETGPVLKNQWIFPGKFEKATKKPKKFDARHGITHHDLYIQIQQNSAKPTGTLKWVNLPELTQVTPSQILQKVLNVVQGKK